jgi:hypothetical protein
VAYITRPPFPFAEISEANGAHKVTDIRSSTRHRRTTGARTARMPLRPSRIPHAPSLTRLNPSRCSVLPEFSSGFKPPWCGTLRFLLGFHIWD